MHLYQLILIIVLGILLYNIFDISPENEIKKPIKSIDLPQLENSKRVTFNLKKNTVYEIDNIKEKKNKSKKINKGILKNNFNLQDLSIMEDNEDNEINEDKKVYGDKILDNKSEFSIENVQKLKDPQKEIIKRLNKKNEKKINLEKDHSFKNQKSYWDSLNIGDFTERDFMNIQVNNFNQIKKNVPTTGIEISKLYDDLTNGITNPTQLNNGDINLNKLQDFNISGYSGECNNLLINNIEN